MVSARGVIRADFTILLILLYVSCIGRLSGLPPVSETSKISANQTRKAHLSNLLSFFFLQKEDVKGSDVPLNTCPCFHCDEQRLVLSDALNASDEDDPCIRDAWSSD